MYVLRYPLELRIECSSRAGRRRVEWRVKRSLVQHAGRRRVLVRELESGARALRVGRSGDVRGIRLDVGAPRDDAPLHIAFPLCTALPLRIAPPLRVESRLCVALLALRVALRRAFGAPCGVAHLRARGARDGVQTVRGPPRSPSATLGE